MRGAALALSAMAIASLAAPALASGPPTVALFNHLDEVVRVEVAVQLVDCAEPGRLDTCSRFDQVWAFEEAPEGRWLLSLRGATPPASGEDAVGVDTIDVSVVRTASGARVDCDVTASQPGHAPTADVVWVGERDGRLACTWGAGMPDEFFDVRGALRRALAEPE